MTDKLVAITLSFNLLRNLTVTVSNTCGRPLSAFVRERPRAAKAA